MARVNILVSRIFHDTPFTPATPDTFSPSTRVSARARAYMSACARA